MKLPALIYCSLTLIIVAFQLALACGAPWGELTMGGRFVGSLPTEMRIAVVLQGLLLTFLATVVWLRASAPGTRTGFLSRAIWFAVATSALALVLNLITPSKRERNLWAPVALVMTVTSLVVARGGVVERGK